MLTRLLVAAGVAIASGAAHADYLTDAVAKSQWTLGVDDAGLGGGTVYLSSSGQNPFKSGAWSPLTGVPGPILFSANLGAAGIISNDLLRATVSLLGVDSGGSTVPTSVGEWFVAPANATISEFDFTIANSSSGTNATFVLATWDPDLDKPLAVLFAASSVVNNDGAADKNVNMVPDIALTAGRDYVAFLTVSSAVKPTGGGLSASPVPETSTWVMMGLGFAGLGIAGRQLRRKASPIPA